MCSNLNGRCSAGSVRDANGPMNTHPHAESAHCQHAPDHGLGLYLSCCEHCILYSGQKAVSLICRDPSLSCICCMCPPLPASAHHFSDQLIQQYNDFVMPLLAACPHMHGPVLCSQSGGHGGAANLRQPGSAAGADASGPLKPQNAAEFQGQGEPTDGGEAAHATRQHATAQAFPQPSTHTMHAAFTVLIVGNILLAPCGSLDNSHFLVRSSGIIGLVMRACLNGYSVSELLRASKLRHL